MLDLFFLNNAQPYPLLWAQHDPWLVALSVAMAVLASVLALEMAGLARSADTRFMRKMARGSGAMALGGGIWSMHFIGILAFTVLGRGRFDPWMTALSILASVAASWVALALLMRHEISRTALVVGGVLVGAGIGAMHYISMEASEWAPIMRFDPWGFAASLLLAVLLAIGALWVRFGLERVVRWQARWLNLAAGAVMGLAIAAPHYVAMAALRFIDAPGELELATTVEGTSLALAVAAVALVIGGLVIAINVGLRYRQMFLQMQQSESRLRAIADTAVDGMVMIDAQGRVQSFNAAAERILGWRPEDVVGQNVSILMPEPDRSRHDTYIQRYLQGQGGGLIGGNGREVLALRPDGSTVPIRISIGRVPLDGDPVFVGFINDLTQRRAMELELQASEQRLRSLMANIPGVTFRCRYDADWTMLFISDAVTALTGWLPQDFLEGRVNFTQLTLPEEVDRLWAEVSTAIQEHRPYHVEFGLRDRDGRLRWVSESGRPVVGEDGQVLWIDGVIMDMTAFKERNAEFESIVRAINRALAVVEFDMQGHVLHANDNFLNLIGYDLQEIVGQHHRMFCEPAYVQTEAYVQFWEQLRSGQLDGGEYLRLGKDGRRIWIQATYNPIFDAKGQPFKVVKFETDLSQRRAMEQELRTAKERAETAAAARASFLANMSHEIRTPMNAIIGFTEALLDSPLDATQRRQLGTVQHAARSLLHLLNGILDTAKLDKGAVVLEVLDFSLRQLCQQMLDTLRISAARKGLPVVLDYPESEPDHLRGDALRLQQVLLNLLGNAIKFTESGQVLLRVRYQAGTLHVDVEDTGIGMSAAQLERIFDPFAQADASTARRFGGTGLGTTIAHQLVQLMHGEISVRSQPGEGSVFSVRLPLPLGQPTPAHAQPTEIVLPPLRILAVDDVPANLELLQIALAQGGHRVVLAGNGQEALDCCARQRFDLVLMDLQMPNIDGLEATRRIRQREQAQGLPRLPIIALSASVLEEDQGLALAAGMDGFAHKPLDRQRLFAEIARVLGLDASAPAQQPGSATASTGDAPIDWVHGCRQWGSEAALREALGRFMQGHPDLPAQLQALRASSGTSALEAQAHRLRGATANLALAPLQAQLGRVEAAARAADAAAIDQAMAQLPTVWEALLHALPPTADTPPATAAPLLDAAHTAQALSAIEQAQQALQRGELPDAALATLAALLPADALVPLQHALNHFDLEGAAEQLQPLRARLQEPPP